MRKRTKIRRFASYVYATLQIAVILVMLVIAVGITYLIASSDLPLWLKFLILKR